MEKNEFHIDDLYLGRFRPDSQRLPGWDYANPGWYFVTICAWKKMKYFGDIINGQMVLSDLGKIARQCWLKIPIHFSHVKLDEFIIMPDHLHGIIQIVKYWNISVETCHGMSLRLPFAFF